MDSHKLVASHVEGFQRKGQAWFCTTGLPSDIIVEVEEMSFHLHKFPLVSKSRKLARLVAEASKGEDECSIRLGNVPGGPEAFELAAQFCYGVRIELTAANVIALRCAAENLEMTEELGEGNLIVKCDNFLNEVVLRSWKDSVRALQGCHYLLPEAEELNLVKKCVDSIVLKACTDPNLFGWSMEHSSMQSPGGSLLWNGISTGAKPKNSRSAWWYDDISILSLPLYKRVISAMESKGLRSESIAGAVMHYAKKSLPGLNRRRKGRDTAFRATVSSEGEQRELLDAIETLLPVQKGATSTQFLLGLLRIAMILNSSSACKSSLEKRIGAQLEQATLEELLIPNYSYSLETLYDIDCIQRILEHFLLYDQTHETPSSPQSLEGQLIGSPSLRPILVVAKLIDGYLAEIAPDVNLKPAKFQALAEALPDYARLLHDGLYRAIDVFLKAHPWLTEQERETLSSLMDCQKLSLEACTHAAQNERLPLRVVVQVLFSEQLQLRTAIAGCFLASDGMEPARHSHSNPAETAGLESIRRRVRELESECSAMRQEIEKMGGGGGGREKGRRGVWGKLGCRAKPQVCEFHESRREMVVGSLEEEEDDAWKRQGEIGKGRRRRKTRRTRRRRSWSR